MIRGIVVYYKSKLCVKSDTMLGTDCKLPIRRFVIYPGPTMGCESDYRAIHKGPGMIGMEVICFSRLYDLSSNGELKWYNAAPGHGRDMCLATFSKPILLESADESKPGQPFVIEEEVPKPKSRLQIEWRMNADPYGDHYCWHKLTKNGWKVCK